MSKKLVTVTVKVEVDPDEWSELFSVGKKDGEIRQDVKRFVGYGVASQLEVLGLSETRVESWF